MLTFTCRDDDTQICSCHNVLKCDIVDSVKNGTCKTLADVKSCTKAGSGCGGCMPTVKLVFENTLRSMGQEVTNHCEFSDLLLKSRMILLTTRKYARTSPIVDRTFAILSP